MSDRGIPSYYRYMHGYSSHAYSMINANNERVRVKHFFCSQQGILNLTDQEAEMVMAKDREPPKSPLQRDRAKEVSSLGILHPSDDRRAGQ